ncbi:cytochrome c oxidase subunit 7A-related protein, mitochondrial [Copidosoma floridanum]|uniref:cytochrome c oxidase subunit 7A-related protein, mitochondrial n=1 Tax=Copidosoma floridanum TaxID=29053 RepID=UPI0006C98E93|nr:cytochrome c oxidase subunit 7A-related protein, mitochondrial [Copidosoma floridanum]
MNHLRTIGLLSRQANLGSRNRRYFHSKGILFKENELFEEKPDFVKKLKLKQAKMQKDDGVPVFLKNGLRSKILYNFTLIMTIISTCYSFKILYDLDHMDKE